MTEFRRHDLPADIAVFHGDFADQPLVFAHLLDVAPDLDLTHVVVIQSNHAARLAAHFSDPVIAGLPLSGTVILILPDAFQGLKCPVPQTEMLRPVGSFRGTVPRMVAV